MNHQQSYERKLDAIRQVLRQRKALGVRLVSQRAVNWLTNIRSFINQATENSVAEVIVTSDDAWLVTNNIEVERIAEEELNGIKLPTTAFNWYEPQTKEQVVASVASALGFRVRDARGVRAPPRIDCIRNPEHQLWPLPYVAARAAESSSLCGCGSAFP